MGIEGTTRRPTASYVTGGALRLEGGKTIAIGSQPIAIGRASSADLCLDDPEVSALHCELRATAEGVVLKDLGSTNGTLIGQVAIVEGLLNGRCTISVGSTELEFVPAAQPELVDTGEIDAFGPLVGSSTHMRQLYRTLARVAPTDLSVLVTGETGTGKELVARAIHEASPRRDGPFVVVDCGALPESLAESLLFGHEAGSFTGATERKAGVFTTANGGTVFLDELGELPEPLQPKLLRVVAERTVKRLGSSRYEDVDVRVVAATRRDLRRDMNAQRFRDDLYFRIAQVRVELAPLRERTEDIPLLVAQACNRLGRADAAPRVAAYVKSRLRRYDWPGNVRELCNIASVLASLGDEGGEDVLPLEQHRPKPGASMSASGFVQAKRMFEEDYFRAMLDATDGNISEIARRCGLARHQVRSHLRKLGIIP